MKLMIAGLIDKIIRRRVVFYPVAIAYSKQFSQKAVCRKVEVSTVLFDGSTQSPSK